MTVVIDDHLLRDLMTATNRTLANRLTGQTVATTNLWYARLCKSAARHGGGALLGGWTGTERDGLVAALVALPPDVHIEPMRSLAWRMGELSARHRGLSSLGAEAVASAERLSATLVVSARDYRPGIRACAGQLGLDYEAM